VDVVLGGEWGAAVRQVAEGPRVLRLADEPLGQRLPRRGRALAAVGVATDERSVRISARSGHREMVARTAPGWRAGPRRAERGRVPSGR
jgi:hypothetical protein